jgi:hypothetical protein
MSNVNTINLIRCGWLVHDVVSIAHQWCVICAKYRTHEVYSSIALCVVCANQEEIIPVEPS